MIQDQEHVPGDFGPVTGLRFCEVCDKQWPCPTRRQIEQAFIDGSVEGSPIDRDGNLRAYDGPPASLQEAAERVLDWADHYQPWNPAGDFDALYAAAGRRRPRDDEPVGPRYYALVERFRASQQFYNTGYAAGRRALADELAELLESMGDRGDHEFGWKDAIRDAIGEPT